MTENIIHEEEYKGFTIKIFTDDSENNNPRQWDNAGTMVCWYRGYGLGDIQPKESPVDFLRELAKVGENSSLNDMDSLLAKLSKNYIFLPLYVYEHGGITMSTSHTYPYNDRWDSSQVGWIYISKKNAVEEWGKKIFTKEIEEKAIEYLRGEVKTYDNYLTGSVYGYVIEDKDGDVVDSWCGYFPKENDEHEYDNCLIDARENL